MTEKNKAYYDRTGFELIEIWEHEFDQDIQQDHLLAELVKHEWEVYYQSRKYGNLDIREAFFGGRTNNIKFVHNCQEEEEIK